MQESTLLLAQKNLDTIAQENGFITFILDGKLSLELSSGRSLELSDNEIKFQAIEYLRNEISNIEHNF
jgi:hypothetical protein